MSDLKQYEISAEHRKRQLQYADNYRLSQSIEEHNRSKFDWRDLFKTLNRSR